MSKLPYVLQVKSSYPFFETIAAFNIESPAYHYMMECSYAHPEFTYRVVKGTKVVYEIAPKFVGNKLVS